MVLYPRRDACAKCRSISQMTPHKRSYWTNFRDPSNEVVIRIGFSA